MSTQPVKFKKKVNVWGPTKAERTKPGTEAVGGAKLKRGWTRKMIQNKF